jgi:TIR domain
MSGVDGVNRDELLEEGRQLLVRMDSDRPDLHLDEISDWADRVLDWAARAGERVPFPGAALRLVDPFWEQRARAYVEKVVEILSDSSSIEEAAVASGRVFISYVQEDAPVVDRLADDLKSYGARVWLDRDDLQLGLNWKESIHRAITTGSFFLWCASVSSVGKTRSYVNEELNLAIEELRMRSSDQAWFLPVKLSVVDVPDRDIGGGRRLRDLQWVDLSADWYRGVRRIAQLVAPLPPKERILLRLLESPDARERADVAQRIYNSPDPRLVIPLCELIIRAGPRDNNAVYWAGRALARLADTRAVPVLIEAVLRGIGHQYKLIENLKQFHTDESLRFIEQYESAGNMFDQIRWVLEEADRRGVTRREDFGN